MARLCRPCALGEHDRCDAELEIDAVCAGLVPPDLLTLACGCYCDPPARRRGFPRPRRATP